jgi:acyl-CoA thioesterase
MQPVPPAQPYPGLAPFDAAEKQRRLALHRGLATYLESLGLRLVDLEPGYARMELPFQPELTHSGGVMQGGLITTLADSSIAHAAVAALDPERFRTSTIELKINFIRPAVAGIFTSHARLIHLGRRTAVGEAEITDDRGRLVAKCLSSLMVIPQDEKAPRLED